MTRSVLSAAVGALALSTGPLGATASILCPWGLSAGETITVLAVADDGTFSGTSESYYYDLNVKDVVDVRSPGALGCFAVRKGVLLGTPVILVGTGIGPVPTSSCFTELFALCGEFVKEVIYTGTSGWSPMVGGLLNPDDCSGTNPPDADKQIHFGDICVTDISVNWEAKKATWNQQCDGAPNVCTQPEEIFGPEAFFLYGQSIFYSSPSVSQDLMAEIMAQSVTEPPPEEMVTYDAYYWGNVSAGTGLDYTSPLGTPTIYGSHVCIEVDGQFFYSGHPWEVVARDYTAMVLTEAHGMDHKRDEVLAVAAMEAVAWMPIVQKYNEVSGRDPVPYATVRASSNHLAGAVSEGPAGFWTDSGTFEEDFSLGYAYAIKTGGTLVLEMLKARCLAMLGSTSMSDDDMPMSDDDMSSTTTTSDDGATDDDIATGDDDDYSSSDDYTSTVDDDMMRRRRRLNAKTPSPTVMAATYSPSQTLSPSPLMPTVAPQTAVPSPAPVMPSPATYSPSQTLSPSPGQPTKPTMMPSAAPATAMPTMLDASMCEYTTVAARR